MQLGLFRKVAGDRGRRQSQKGGLSVSLFPKLIIILKEISLSPSNTNTYAYQSGYSAHLIKANFRYKKYVISREM